MNFDTTTILTTCAAGVILASIRVFWKHISNTNRHPPADKIVFTDVCRKTVDCIEVELKNLNEKVDKVCTKTDKILEILLKRK